MGSMTTMTNRKSRGRAKASSCNVVSVSSRETEEGVASLTDSEEEEFVLAVNQDAPPIFKNYSSKQYLKKYNEVMASLPKPTKETTEPPMKQPVKKQKELRYTKALQKDYAERSQLPSTLMSWISLPTFLSGSLSISS